MAQQQYSLAFMMRECMKKVVLRSALPRVQGRCNYVRRCDTSVLIMFLLIGSSHGAHSSYSCIRTVTVQLCVLSLSSALWPFIWLLLRPVSWASNNQCVKKLLSVQQRAGDILIVVCCSIFVEIQFIKCVTIARSANEPCSDWIH